MNLKLKDIVAQPENVKAKRSQKLSETTIQKDMNQTLEAFGWPKASSVFGLFWRFKKGDFFLLGIAAFVIEP